VLVDGELPDGAPLQIRAAAMAVGPDLVACHSTAALLWDFDVVGAETLHFLGPPRLVNRRRPGIQIHPSSLGCADAVRVAGVWCTPAARTACDVVRLTAPIDGLPTLDAALRSAWCTREELAAAATAQAGLREVVRLRSLVPLADRRAESPMESRMRWRFVEGGLPAPDLQVRVSAEGRQRYLDTGWRDQRVGAEFDGVEAHMTPQQLRDDRMRHNWLTEEGWTLLHFTATDVYRRHRQMVATAARALGLPLPSAAIMRSGK
jgi:very-short-patch-repair endonuclease